MGVSKLLENEGMQYSPFSSMCPVPQPHMNLPLGFTSLVVLRSLTPNFDFAEVCCCKGVGEEKVKRNCGEN